MKLIDIDQQFSTHYKELLAIQERGYKQLYDYSYNLAEDEITACVINRMQSFWFFNVNNNKNILERHSNTVAADFFTETCLLYLKAYFQSKHGLLVKSEVSIVKSRNAIRPDISIWKEDSLIAAIELKVNDGWKRRSIIEHLQHREEIIKTHYPNAFFGVIAFWNFFDTSLPEFDTKYISLLHWNPNENHPRTGSRIESLILAIENHISS